MPWRISTLPIIWLRKQQGNDPENFKKIQCFICDNPLYAKHTIDVNSLDDLPKDGLVLEMLPVHDNFNEKNINDISFCVSSQETEINTIPEES